MLELSDLFCRCLKTLIKHRANVNDHAFDDGSAPLHLAALAGNEDCLQSLIESGVKEIILV